MRRFALPPLTSTALSLLATLTVWWVLRSWQVLSQRHDFLMPLLGLSIAVALVGGLIRSLTHTGFWAVVATGTLTLVFVWLQISGQAGHLGSFPAWADAVEVARRSARTYHAPVGESAPTIAPLLVISGAMLIFAFDLVVSTLRRVTFGALLLVAAATIPVAVTGEAMGWGWFVVAGLAYCGLLYGYQYVALQRWGRGTAAPAGAMAATTAGSERRLSTPVTALAVAACALALAVAVPAWVSLPESRISGGAGWGWGASSDDGPIEVSNPAADMRRDLNRGQDRPVLRLTTDDPDPSYLRLGTLNSFNGSAWTPGDRDVRTRAHGTLPRSAGLKDSAERNLYSYSVQPFPVLRSDWLPTMPLTSTLNLPSNSTEDWTVDPHTLDVFHGGNDKATTRDVGEYGFAAYRPDWRPDELDGGGSGRGAVPALFTELPDNVPESVEDLAKEITRDATTSYERAQALQRWFRVGGGFTYSLDRAPAGSGNETLAGFLAPGGRVGYCEQFSAAMAVMARELGIPARVAVGWLRPEKIEEYDDGQALYEYSSHDAHAWVEVFLPGAGWVSFEPTPATRASRVPSWTEDSGNRPAPSASASASTSASTSATPSARPSSAAPTPTASATTAQGAGTDDSTWSRILVWVAAALLVLGLLAVVALLPRAVRRRRRGQRLLAGDPEGAWRELHDTARDLGLDPPVGRSLRETGSWFLEQLAAPNDTRSGAALTRGPQTAPAASAEVESLVHALESLRYAPAASTPEWVWPEAALAALGHGVTSTARRQAAWWPRSVLSRR